MYKISKQIHFCYGDRLLRHKGKCARLHGHNGVAEIVCRSAELDKNRMVVDFDRVSETINAWIMNNLDHRMILSAKDPVAPLLKKQKEPFFEMSDDPTAEAMAELIFGHARRLGLPVVRVTMWETPSSSASYSPK